jgi:hypothetical protein
MITREQFGADYRAGCQGAPPPLHVYSAEAEHAAWHPLARPVMHPHAPGPVMVTIPAPPGQLYGDDPTDPAAQTVKRTPTVGMVARLNIHPAGYSSVAGSGVRL